MRSPSSFRPASRLACALIALLPFLEIAPDDRTPMPDPDTWSVHHTADLLAQRADSGRPYLPFLDHPTLSMGVYVLPAGGHDGQQPHRQDETYYVLQGSARLIVGSDTTDVTEGDVIFVAAGASHRFFDLTTDLSLLVFFSKAPVD